MRGLWVHEGGYGDMTEHCPMLPAFEAVPFKVQGLPGRERPVLGRATLLSRELLYARLWGRH